MTGWIVRETVIRERATFVEDGHRDLVADWSNPATLTIEGCLFAPAESAEVNVSRDAVKLVGTVYAPPDVDVTAMDRIVRADVRYQVVGQPQAWRAGTVIALENWTG